MLRCAESPRVNVSPIYTSARRSITRHSLDLLNSLQEAFSSNLLSVFHIEKGQRLVGLSRKHIPSRGKESWQTY